MNISKKRIFILLSFIILTLIICPLTFVTAESGESGEKSKTNKRVVEIVSQINNSGYGSMINADNYINFKAFEYSVLMDAAEYLRNNKQDMFDIGTNESEYKYERNLLKEKKPEEYKAKLEELSKFYSNVDGTTGEPTAIPLLTVNSSDGTSSVKGGTNRAKGPYFVYEFKVNGMDNESGENDSNVDDLLAKGELSGSLEPYIYVIKEDIKFSYYFDKDGKVIEYPLILNVYNSKLNVGQESGAEMNRALLGLAPVVWPDVDADKYTMTPYYSDETTPVIYKIPLRTILGRFLPKQELLLTWSMLKQNVDKSGDQMQEKDFMDYVIDGIKGIYSDACLDGEKVQKESGDRTIINTSGDLDKQTYYYSKATTHNKTFATFEKAGIEYTRYDINGLQDIDSGDGEKKIKLVTNFVSATIVLPEINVKYYASNPDRSNPEDLYKSEYISGEKTIKMTQLAVSGYSHRNVILAVGDPQNGYYPPSSIDGEDTYLVIGKNAQQVKLEISQKIREKLEEELGYQNVSIVLPEDTVRYNPVFITDKGIKVSKKLKIEHTRMATLLVTSAKTWCKEATYEHKISQTQFKQNHKEYIKAEGFNGNKSLGLEKFSTEMKAEYRGKAYSEVFSKMQEKDVTNMLLQFEKFGSTGNEDAYEFMRDLYKLVKASQNYSNEHYSGDVENTHYIHPDTYTYVHMPDSVLKYNDSETQKIFWLNLLAATADDPITKKEISYVRTRNQPISWQIVDYNSKGCDGKVYALHPLGNYFVRTYYDTMQVRGQKVDGGSKNSTSGANWTGRKLIDNIIHEGNSITGNDGIGGDIYKYQLDWLKKRYNSEEKAKAQLKVTLNKLVQDMPVVSVAPGKVEEVAFNLDSGFYVVIKHSDKESITTRYSHLKRWPLVSVGDYVGAGTVIGYEGNTGKSYENTLHFQILKSGNNVSDTYKYVFPIFNPFFNDDRASGEKYDIYSDYMSIERTYRMVNKSDKDTAKITNRVPDMALVSDATLLIQNQGAIDRTVPETDKKDWGDAASYKGEKGWNTSGDYDSVEKFVKHLEKNNYYDLYLEEAFFDKELARSLGYLDVPYELLDYIYGNIIVKTDLPGALPALSREELDYIIQNWIPSRFSESDVKWLMENVFTETNIEAILAAQNEYKVSAVFALAVATQEQSLGTAYVHNNKFILGKPGICNIFSIKGKSAPHAEYDEESKEIIINENEQEFVLYQKGKEWRKYGTYANAFADFSYLIAERGPYFKDGRYTIGTIGPVYCEGTTWSKAVTSIVLEIMQYYIGSDWSLPDGNNIWFGDNATLLNAIINCTQYYVYNDFDYCQESSADRKLPPYEGNPLDFSNAPCRQNKATCSECGSAKRGGTPLYRTDCSTYVTWCLYEYARACGESGLIDLIKTQGVQINSGTWVDIGKKLLSGNKTWGKYFQVVCSKQQGNIPNSFDALERTLLQPGDILVEYTGYSGTHHVEFYVGPDTDNIRKFKKRDGSTLPGKGKIFSCGLYLNKSKPYDYQWNALQFVIRPLPLGRGIPIQTPVPDVKFNSPKFDADVSQALLNAASSCIKYLSDNAYHYKNEDEERMSIPPYNEKGNPKKGDSRAFDCVKFVEWVTYEYNKVNNKEVPYSDRIETYYEHAKNIGNWKKYYNPVYASEDVNANGMGYKVKAKAIYETLKPGDILIYTTDYGDGKSHHIDIFAGFADDQKEPKNSDKYMKVKIYSGGTDPTASEYTKGEPMVKKYYMKRNGTSKAHGFWDMTAVLRIK